MNGPSGSRSSATHFVLAVNGGSSSIKFALYRTARFAQVLRGNIDRIGTPGTRLVLDEAGSGGRTERAVSAADHRCAADVLIECLKERMSGVVVIGHRIVHGMQHIDPEPVTQALLNHLRSIIACDPDHLPRELQLIEAVGERYPALPQVACFDTAFHSTLPRVARLLAIPRRYAARGIQRYGFHGLSYAYLMEELAQRAGAEAARGKVVLAHLGNGASLAAVRDGISIDTSMGFTPVGGLPMGTRPGDLDPGVAWYLMENDRLTPREFNDLINHESGLLGISETSADMRDLMAREAGDPRAADAIALFCYQARKWIGAFAAALEGLETLVFAGGIGENVPAVRARICDPLAFLGVALDDQRNRTNAAVISAATSRVRVHVIPTDEEVMIAKTAWRVLNR